VRMRFATRAFLWSFIPFAILLACSFWVIQRRVQHTVRSGLRSSLREAHISMARLRQESELQNGRFPRIVAENPPLKAGLRHPPTRTWVRTTSGRAGSPSVTAIRES
jgi:hypothetical protein